MVGVRKFTALAAVSAVAVTGAAASLQPADASHANHRLSHRSLAERQLNNQQQPPSMVKVQKRLVHAIADGLGGIIGGLGNDLGFTDLGEAEYHLHNLRRGLVGDVLGAGGQGGAPPSSSASSAPAPASTSRAPTNNAPASSANAPASSRPAALSAPAAASSRPASSSSNNNINNNNNRPSSASTSNNTNNTNNNNNSGNQASANTSNNNNAGNNGGNRGSAQQQAAASNAIPAAPTSNSAAAASLISAASASQASGDAAASAAAASLARAGSSTAASAASAASTTGANRANSSGSNRSSDGTTKVVVPIVVIALSVAAIAIAWTVIRRIRKRNADKNDPRLQPIERSYHHRSMVVGPPLAAEGAALAVGGAAAGLVRDRPRRDSYDSYHAGRPMSTLTEEDGLPPPMQEVAPYSSVGSAYAPPASRLRNHDSTRGGNEDFPPAHRITDSMYVDDYGAHSGAVTPFSDEHGAYDVNYYDGSSTAGYNNRATKGIDAAGTEAAGRPYSPYADLQRSEAGDDERYYDYDRASSSRNRADPFSNSSRWSG